MGLKDNMNSLRYVGESTVEKMLKALRLSTEKDRSENQKMLEEYRTALEEYQAHLDLISSTEEDQMAAIQVALDLTYIKEELDRIAGSQKEIGQNISKIDNTIIEPIKQNYTANRNATIEKLDEVISTVENNNRGLKTVLWVSLFFNILCAGGLTFVILWILQLR